MVVFQAFYAVLCPFIRLGDSNPQGWESDGYERCVLRLSVINDYIIECLGGSLLFSIKITFSQNSTIFNRRDWFDNSMPMIAILNIRTGIQIRATSLPILLYSPHKHSTVVRIELTVSRSHENVSVSACFRLAMYRLQGWASSHKYFPV